MHKQKYHIGLCFDNAPAHPPDILLENIRLKHFLANTIPKIQPMKQRIILAFKAYYRCCRAKHIITGATTGIVANVIHIIAFDTVYWIDSLSDDLVRPQNDLSND